MQSIAQVPGWLSQLIGSDLAWKELKQSQDEWTNAECVHLPGVQGSNRRATYQSHLWGYTYQDHHRGCRCTQYCDLQMTAVRWLAGYGRTVRQSQMDHSHCLCLARTMGMKDHHDPAPSPESLCLPLPSLWPLLTQSSQLKRGSPCTSDMLTKKGLEKMGVGRERKLWEIGRQEGRDPRVTAASA